jgi:alpha-N-arabinofuranosidase
MDELINRHYAVPLNYGLADKMKLVIDEWGCWHPDGSGPSKGYNLFEQQSTMRDAVVAAITLNIFNNNSKKIKMANVAQLCNNLHSLFLSAGNKLITTPTYHVFDMYKAHMGAECLSTVVTDNSGSIDQRISVSASRKGGFVTLTAANLSISEDVNIDIELLGADMPDSFSVTVLYSDEPRAHNTFECPDKVVPTVTEYRGSIITLPRASVVSVKFKV